MLAKQLKQKSAYALHSEMADGCMDLGDPEPAHLATLNAMRIAKCRSQSEDSSKHAVLALYDMKQRKPSCIQNIGLNPFHVYYSTDAQRAWYKHETSRKRTVVSIDATGLGLLPPLHDKTYIFLYVICAHGMFQIN